jgi:hypothetical protein
MHSCQHLGTPHLPFAALLFIPVPGSRSGVHPPCHQNGAFEFLIHKAARVILEELELEVKKAL